MLTTTVLMVMMMMSMMLAMPRPGSAPLRVIASGVICLWAMHASGGRIRMVSSVDPDCRGTADDRDGDRDVRSARDDLLRSEG